MKIINFFNIVWDTSTESDEDEDCDPPDLPTECHLEVDEEDLDEVGAAILSDKYGWGVYSFEWKIDE